MNIVIRTKRLRAIPPVPREPYPRTARASVPAGNNSCYTPRRAVGDGGGGGVGVGVGAAATAPPSTSRDARWCAPHGWLRTFLRRCAFLPGLRRQRRRSRLVRIGWWDLLPVQQRGSVRLLHHGGGGGAAAACEDSGREKNMTKLRCPVESSRLNTLLEPDHDVLLPAGLLSVYL